MDEIALHAGVLSVCALGFVALIPGPDRAGRLRLTGAPGAIITYAGILFLLGPWIALPFLPQPAYSGLLRSILRVLGALLLAAGLALYAAALAHLLSAFREQFSEFTPSTVVVSGPYRFVRHPIYLACLLIVTGLYLVLSASLSIVFLPLLWALLRGITVYEERRILIPKFGQQYRHYRARVRRAILGTAGVSLAACLYLPLAAFALLPLLPR